MDTLVLSLPLKVLLGHKRDKSENWFYMNLNEYRNAHYQILNKAKILFKEAIQSQLSSVPVFDTVQFEYFFFPGSSREIDTNNVCSVVDKFFSDAFVESGKLEDDNYKFLTDTRFTFSNIDRNNPRVDVHIKGKLKEENMQLQANLTHEDFMAALNKYVKEQFPIPEGITPQIDITAGRGDKGYSAVVIYDLQSPSAKVDPLQQILKREGNTMNRLEADPLGLNQKKDEAPAEAVTETATEAVGRTEGINTDDPETQPQLERPQPAGAPLTTPEVKPATAPLFAPPKSKEEATEAVGGAAKEPARNQLFSFGS